MDTKQSLKLYVVLSRAYHAITEADRKEIIKYGISQSEFAVLELLHHKGPQPIQYIASKVLLKSGSMTYVVTQLEKKELVKRVVSEKDRRIYYVELTKKGRTLIADAFPVHEEFLDNLMSSLSSQEKQSLIHSLKILGKAIENKEELQC